MSTYELFLLLGALLGALGIMSLASVILDRGSLRVFFTLAILSGGALFMADRASEDGLNSRDLVPAIAKVIAMVRSG